MMTAAPMPGQEAPTDRPIVSRFAPSPTGRLHLGHAFSAIAAHDRARSENGRFLLRIEDIDGARSRREFVDGIVDDLTWLGLGWDGPVVFQSARLGLYRAVLDRLCAMGLLYPCCCTRAGIAASLSAPHGTEGAVYPGTCRRRAPADRAALIASGRAFAWRLDMAAALARADPLVWYDEIAGEQRVDPSAAGDVVLARKDTPASYHLAVTLDDAAQGVSHVVRGRDLFAATHVHRLLQALLDLPVPVWRHHPLLTDEHGERLAKRRGAPALADLRAAGTDGRALAEALRTGQVPTGFGLASA